MFSKRTLRLILVLVLAIGSLGLTGCPAPPEEEFEEEFEEEEFEEEEFEEELEEEEEEDNDDENDDE